MSRVLIVDDDVSIAQMVVAVLADEGIAARAVTHASDLDAAMSEQRPELVLLDVNMPGARGGDGLAWLRRGGPLAGIPAVVMTGDPDALVGQDASKLGIAACLLKPFEIEDLVAIVSKLLS